MFVKRELRCSVCDRGATFAAIERSMKEPGWIEVKDDDGEDLTPAYTIGDAPVFGFDAYCPAGQERKVYDDPR